MHALDPAHLFNGATAVVFVALGLWVLRARRGRVNVAFAGYAFSWAATLAISNFAVEVGHSSRASLSTYFLASTLVVLHLVLLVAAYPSPIRRHDRTALLAALAGAVAIGALWLASEPGWGRSTRTTSRWA